MADASTIATHQDPVWRDRTNYVVRLDLTPHGMAGRFEQMWARTDDGKLFELCCIPFFPYGMSLGDTLRVEHSSGQHDVVRKGGHRTLRIAFVDKAAAHERHAWLHEQLVELADCLVEFRGPHYLAVDLADEDRARAVPDLLAPLRAEGIIIWEWADPVREDV